MDKNKTIIIAIAVVVVLGGGWYILQNNGNNEGSEVVAPVTQTPSTQTEATGASDYHDNIYLTKTDTTKGTYMTDFAGKTLYVFDNDTPNVSNCTGQCATKWFFYTSGATVQGQFPAGITVFTRADGSKQFQWNNRPLYYYSGDSAVGDLNGDGVGGIWHIVKF